jgi:hypothetical protein
LERRSHEVLTELVLPVGDNSRINEGRLLQLVGCGY